jgi:transcriptional regulator with XRE-family HTH domain
MIGSMSDWDARKGAAVRKRRQVLGWDQRELAERTGVHVNSVQRWEKGAQYPGRHLGRLEAVLGIALESEPEQAPEEMPTPAELDGLRDNIRETLGPRAQRLLDALDAVVTENSLQAGKRSRRGPSNAVGHSDEHSLAAPVFARQRTEPLVATPLEDYCQPEQGGGYRRRAGGCQSLTFHSESIAGDSHSPEDNGSNRYGYRCNQNGSESRHFGPPQAHYRK